MNDMMEITELNFDDASFGNNKSSNFGGGLELLMNDKIKESKRNSSDINFDDVNKLENELNELVEDMPFSDSFKPKSDFFNKPGVSFDDNISIKFNIDDDYKTLGQSTSQQQQQNYFSNENDTHGYNKFNDIPLNPDKPINLENKMSKEELLREKFKYLRKLEGLEKKGVELSKKYTMESSLQEMQGEYETIMEEKSKTNSIKFQGNILMAIINGIEFLNGKFDPFDIKLDGWSEQIQENINDYDDIFGELFEKYKSKASMAPELKLLFQLGGSAMMVHMTNTMFKSAMPGVDDIFRQNPDLMRSFQTAAVNSMAQTSPGLSGFMSNIISGSGNGPPPPLATQGPNSIPPPFGRPGNNNYAQPSYQSQQQQQQQQQNFNYGRSSYVDDGISLRENYEKPEVQDRTSKRVSRPEMKGPSDISEILSGLKTKTINIQETSNSTMNTNDTTDNSTISISDLKNLQTDGAMPKRSGRRKKSANNTISLDI